MQRTHFKLNNFFLFFVVAGALFAGAATGCKEPMVPEPPEPKEPVVTLSASWMNGDDEITLNEVFKDGADYSVKVLELKYYLANIQLKKEDGTYITLSDIELFDHKPINPDVTTPQWDRSYQYAIPEGFYTAIKFGLGVPPALNGLDPATYDNDDPLSVYSNTYWSWASMYRFVILEGNIDTLGGTSLNHPVLIHTGLDDLYRPDLEFPISMLVENEDAKDINVLFDWNKIFHSATNPIDLKTRHITHTTDNEDDFTLSEDFTNNAVATIVVK